MIATKQIEIEQGDLIYVMDAVGTRIVALDSEYVVPCPGCLSGYFGLSQRFKLSSLGDDYYAVMRALEVAP